MASISGNVKVGKYEIEKFNGKNDFSYWRMQMKNLLISQKLHRALLGKEKMPADMKDEDWEELDLEARAAIILCLERDVAFLVNEEATAAGVWAKLESNFMTKTLTNRIYLKSKLYTCKMEEGTSIRDYVNKFDRIISNLKDIDVKIDDEDQALILLLSLPKSYENLVQTLMLVGDTLTMDETRASLLADDLRKVATSVMSSSSGRDYKDQAQGLFAARGRTNERGKGKRGKSRPKSRSHAEKTCFKCGEPGHFKANCPNKRVIFKNQNNDNPKEKQEASYVSNGEEDCYSVTEESHEISGKWMLDSGASHHMCPNRKWFTTYESTNGGTVLMGNDHACKTVGLGTIRVKMHDGAVRTLKDVRHIPDLRKNLISIGLLEKNGCKIVADNGVMKVVRGSLVVMKAVRNNNLYPLLGNTVTGNLAIGISGSKDHTECTRIWHMRLGHMSEKGLSLLSGQGLLKNMKKPQMEFCEHCVYGKAHRVKFCTSKHKSKGLLDYVHTDVWGPAKVTSKGGSRYFVTFVDDYSRYA
jgi:LTR polyprotein gag-polypeptide-like protein/Pol polyprotein/gag-pre-integrase-like protein/zinc knuckle protein